MADERKIREIYGVKSVHEEATERTEETWREKLLLETADLRTENALLRAQLDEFSRKLVEATDRNEKLEAGMKSLRPTAMSGLPLSRRSSNSIPRVWNSRTTSSTPRASGTSPVLRGSAGRLSNSMPRRRPWSMRSSGCAASVTPR